MDANVQGRTPWGGGLRTNGYVVPEACKEVEPVPEPAPGPGPEPDPEEPGDGDDDDDEDYGNYGYVEWSLVL